jgi:hypothetical protein
MGLTFGLVYGRQLHLEAQRHFSNTTSLFKQRHFGHNAFFCMVDGNSENCLWETQQHLGNTRAFWKTERHSFSWLVPQLGGNYNLLSGHFHPSRSSVRLSSFVWINPPNSTHIGDFHTIFKRFPVISTIFSTCFRKTA